MRNTGKPEEDKKKYDIPVIVKSLEEVKESVDTPKKTPTVLVKSCKLRTT